MTKAITRHGLQPVIDNSFPFDRLHEACGYFNSQAGFGKIVVRGV
jgi:NADPH:quinone reductase-like Zn-dependent oxidoreductase